MNMESPWDEVTVTDKAKVVWSVVADGIRSDSLEERVGEGEEPWFSGPEP